MDDSLAAFRAGYPFALDDYQVAACEHVAAGRGVLVAAPTGAGKTVVGEFAVHLALQTGRKCFYTTPIKALSNQKYHDLIDRHGEANVGLLTGDTTINGEAPVVVMTTEVLRNMIYAGSRTLKGLGYVVMDEVHYLADRFRGPVWEEVIISLAPSVQLVALSATVSNAEEFGDWLDEVRSGVEVVVSERRPVPLFQHVAVGRRLVDLFATTTTAAHATMAEPDEASVNPELLQLAKQEARGLRDDSRRPRGQSGRGKRTVAYGSGRYGGGGARGRQEASRHLVPRRDGTVERLAAEGLLPAIYFIFSRQGCDTAVRQLMQSGLQLTNRAERAALDAIAERHIQGLSADDLAALEYRGFAAAFRAGIAAHHAGLLPAFKEAVEEGFAAGLVKVVFATETLALGINMPARSVVLEKLVKYNGESHADITAGEYTQLTGRAGRRGIDVEGHAVVCWQPGLDPRALAGLASRRTYPLHSSFKPTYNMAVNLVGTVGRERARALLEQSFAQFQADRRLAARAVPKRRRNETERTRLPRTNTIAVRFDRICSVLEAMGYLTEGGEQVTDAGRKLTRIYSELDLVTAEAIREGVFDRLSAPQLAAVLSSLVYEARGDRRPTRMPDRASERAQSALRAVWRQVSLTERDHRLPSPDQPDIGFAEAIHHWTAGFPLADVLDVSGLTAGDFVRWARQVMDVAGQVAEASDGELRDTCREAIARIRRGVVDVAPLED
ncbi:MAG: DEAD/DEAH box helicase [Propionicimonas sp.]